MQSSTSRGEKAAPRSPPSASCDKEIAANGVTAILLSDTIAEFCRFIMDSTRDRINGPDSSALLHVGPQLERR